MTAETCLTVTPLALIPYDDAPRVRDVELAERLGFDRAANVRNLIERHRAEIESYGVCFALKQTSGPQGGRPATEYHLNEEQALCVAALSRAPRAAEVRRALITTYTAYRRGLVPTGGELTGDEMKRLGGMFKGIVHKQLAEVLPSLVAAELERDPRHVAVGYVPSIEVLKTAGVPAKGRRSLSQQVGARLRRFCIAHGFTVRISRESTRYLFPPEGVAAWLAAEGKSLIAAHMARVTGQGVLKLVPRQ